jgi:hypothetical protein
MITGYLTPVGYEFVAERIIGDEQRTQRVSIDEHGLRYRITQSLRGRPIAAHSGDMFIKADKLALALIGAASAPGKTFQLMARHTVRGQTVKRGGHFELQLDRQHFDIIGERAFAALMVWAHRQRGEDPGHHAVRLAELEAAAAVEASRAL